MSKIDNKIVEGDATGTAVASAKSMLSEEITEKIWTQGEELKPPTELITTLKSAKQLMAAARNERPKGVEAVVNQAMFHAIFDLLEEMNDETPAYPATDESYRKVFAPRLLSVVFREHTPKREVEEKLAVFENSRMYRVFYSYCDLALQGKMPITARNALGPAYYGDDYVDYKKLGFASYTDYLCRQQSPKKRREKRAGEELKLVGTMVTEKQKEKIKEEAEKSGYTVAEYLRRAWYLASANPKLLASVDPQETEFQQQHCGPSRWYKDGPECN